MESEWTENENMDLNTHEEGPDPWKTPRRYHRRKGRDGSTPNSIRRAHKAPRTQTPFDIPFDVENGKHDLLRHLIAQEINLIREDIEIALKEEMKKEIEKQKIELYAALKTELLEEMRKDIISHTKKSHLELKDGMTQYLKDEISSSKVELGAIKVDLEKGQEAVERCISTVKDNVTKEMQTWADMARDAKAQAEHAQKEIKANAPWIEVVKKQKGTSMDRMEMMNATLEEEAKRKARVLHVRVVGWAEKGSPQEDATNLGTKIGASDIPFASAWRVGRDESRAKALIIRFMDIDKKKAFLSKRKALKGEKIYLDDDLTPAQVAHRKENIPRVLEARKEGKWAVYRDGKVIITEKRTA